MDISTNLFSNILDFDASNLVKDINEFRLFYNNIRSLKNKIEEIEILINNYKVDLAILTETWINKREKRFYNMNNYNSIYSCRQRQGGGLGLFLLCSLEYKIIENYESEQHSCIIIKIEKLRLIILATYRPPNYNINDFLNFLDMKIHNYLEVNYKCIIIGDININIINNNQNSIQIMDLYKSNNFILCNGKHPTRHSGNNHSLLDHIAVNFREEIKLSIIQNSLSDHDIQIIDINLRNKINIDGKYTIQSTTKLNYESLDKKLNKLEEDLLANDHNVHELYNSIVNSYSTSTSRKNIKIKKGSKPWFNDHLKYLISQRDYYFERKKVYPNNELIRNIYNKCNNLVKQSIRKAKKNYFENKFTNVNSKNIWKTINFAMHNKSENKTNEIKTLIKENNKITDPHEICEEFNNFFVNVGQDLANKIQKSDRDYPDKLHQNSMILNPTNENEAKNFIKKLINKKSSEYDNININMIK